MSLVYKRYGLLVLGLISSALVYGCGEQLYTTTTNQGSGMVMDNNQKEVRRNQGKEGELTLAVNAIDGRLHYLVSIIVANGCYSKGLISESLVENGHVELSAVIDYKPGICTQALRDIHFEGVLTPSSECIQKVTVNITDARSGNAQKKTVSVSCQH
jgi:hypothetical protein